MHDFPTGTVTFLFTDIEGSTRLWEQHPEPMRAALARHDALLRQAIEARGGTVFKTMGDQFCAAFATAPAAVAAAFDAQLALQIEPWTEVATVRVRMALHTGAAEARGGDYFGPALNRVARLLAAGHGGQILLSQAAGDLARDALPPDTSLRDLGAHRLKDLQQPEHLFQLLSPSLPEDFPPLRSLESFSHNLPAQLTSFIGREKEIAEVKELLVGQAVSLPGALGRQANSLPHTRLLTLTGSGGCGKTRLALHLAAELLEQYPDGVWLVELAALADPALVPQAVASALGVREEPNRPLLATLSDSLRTKSLLLVLDNCEHLLAACAELADTLLRACPKLQILASSREGLGIAGETTYRVPSLSLPEPQHLPSVARLMQFEAARLFIDRAKAALPSFTVTPQNALALAQVCQRLDGIPLAIELAAARVKALSVEKLSERLDDMFRLLTGGSRTALPRQQTLRALIDWSYDLLSPPEQALLRRLSVFAGGWTLEAAEAACGDDEGRSTNDQRPETGARALVGPSSLVVGRDDVLDLLTSLVEKSLVLYEERGGEGRYRLLETVRQYARDRLLEAGEVEAVRGRHLTFFLHLAESSQAASVEDDNFRAALDWCRARSESRQDPAAAEMGLRLAVALWWAWLQRNFVREARENLGYFLAVDVPPAAATLARATAFFATGFLANLQGDYPEARILVEQSLRLYRELGDEGERAIGDVFDTASEIATNQGDLVSARSFAAEALSARRKVGNSYGVAWSLCHLGALARREGEYERAKQFLEESLGLFREFGDGVLVGWALNDLGQLYQQQGELAQAHSLCREALTLVRTASSKVPIARSLEGYAGVVTEQGESDRATRLWGAAEALRESIGVRQTPEERARCQRAHVTLRAALGEEAFAAAWAEGRAMSLESVVEYALAELTTG